MFEKAKPINALSGAPRGGPTREDPPRQHAAPAARRAGDALRAVEWSELTARLNAARDLRLLLRHESQAPIEAVAASFGDAAASYFALLDDGEPGVNHNALGQSKVLDANIARSDTARHDHASGENAAAGRGDARETR